MKRNFVKLKVNSLNYYFASAQAYCLNCDFEGPKQKDIDTAWGDVIIHQNQNSGHNGDVKVG